MATVSNAGSMIGIGNSTTQVTAALYKTAGGPYLAVDQLEDIGEFGDVAAKIEAKIISSRRVKKAKGSLDAGTLEITVLRDPADVGQNALRAAAKSDTFVNVKVELADKLAAPGFGTTFYFRGIVFAAPNMLGDADSFVKQKFVIEIDSEILEVAATAS